MHRTAHALYTFDLPDITPHQLARIGRKLAARSNRFVAVIHPIEGDCATLASFDSFRAADDFLLDECPTAAETNCKFIEFRP